MSYRLVFAVSTAMFLSACDGSSSSDSEEMSVDPVISNPVDADPVESDPVESDPVDSDPVDPDPVDSDPVASDPAAPDPVDSNPVDADPVDPDPVDSDPVALDPADPDPVDSNPVEADPIDPDPVDSDPVEADPVDPEPVDSDPVEADPVDPDPVEADPVEADPVDADPVDLDPVDSNPVDQAPVVDVSLGATNNLRGVVYNNAEIEIFWDRSSSEAEVIAYQIERNGDVLAPARDGLSYFDDTVEPGQSYTYEVTPLGVENSIGSAAQIMLVTPPNIPEISATNVLERFNYLISLASSESVTNSLNVPPPEAGGNTSSESGPDGVETIYECTVSGRRISRQSSNAVPFSSTTYEACRSSEAYVNTLISGSFSSAGNLSSAALNSGFGTDRAWSDVSVLKSDQQLIEFSGFVNDFSGSAGDSESWRLEYEATAFEGRTDLAVAISVSDGTTSGDPRAVYARTWRADITIQSPITNNRLIVLETVEPFSSPNTNGCYETGNLVATAVDGTRLEVDVDTGNLATFYLDAIVDGEVFRQELFWSEHVQSNDLLTDACG